MVRLPRKKVSVLFLSVLLTVLSSYAMNREDEYQLIKFRQATCLSSLCTEFGKERVSFALIEEVHRNQSISIPDLLDAITKTLQEKKDDYPAIYFRGFELEYTLLEKNNAQQKPIQATQTKLSTEPNIADKKIQQALNLPIEEKRKVYEQVIREERGIASTDPLSFEEQQYVNALVRASAKL